MALAFLRLSGLHPGDAGESQRSEYSGTCNIDSFLGCCDDQIQRFPPLVTFALGMRAQYSIQMSKGHNELGSNRHQAALVLCEFS